MLFRSSWLLTIDSQLQQEAEQAILEGIAEAHKQGYGNADAGVVVALDPRNGEILAMASYPEYDPTVWVGGVSPGRVNARDNVAQVVGIGRLVVVWQRVTHRSAKSLYGFLCPISILIGHRRFYPQISFLRPIRGPLAILSRVSTRSLSFLLSTPPDNHAKAASRGDG